ncbi:DHH family phosphoesterase [archaeon]|nr:DHH family phosphoesterase [archaeon]
MKYFKDAVEFLNKIDEKDGIIIVFNNDGDGICACSLMLKFLETKGVKKPYVISQPMPMDKNLVDRVKTAFPKKIIFLDLVADQQEDIIKKLRGFADILIVDHHRINKNLNKDNVVEFNPRFTKPGIYQSTTYLVYKLCSELMDITEYLWIAGVGIVSDYLRLEDPKKVEENNDWEKLVKSYHMINDELASLEIDAKENSMKRGDVVFYEVKSSYNLGSSLSTKLSEKYMDKLVIIYNKSGSKMKVSARNQKKNINADRVMRIACKGLKASGGGHEAAAGATVDEKDWEKFKNRIIEMLQ